MWSALKLELAKHFARYHKDIKKQVDFEGEVDWVMSRFSHQYKNSQFIMGIRAHLSKYLVEDEVI